mmetsp:Transcript_25564/g.50355  ORF Transcript_25564/g.50355 Transcript_25564/m.50355 type:complete len:219 (+) Transcript_25564:105-761(+)
MMSRIEPQVCSLSSVSCSLVLVTSESEPLILPGKGWRAVGLCFLRGPDFPLASLLALLKFSIAPTGRTGERMDPTKPGASPSTPPAALLELLCPLCPLRPLCPLSLANLGNGEIRLRDNSDRFEDLLEVLDVLELMDTFDVFEAASGSTSESLEIESEYARDGDSGPSSSLVRLPKLGDQDEPLAFAGEMLSFLATRSMIFCLVAIRPTMRARTLSLM